jgi:low affinity Fe/Cu permease
MKNMKKFSKHLPHYLSLIGIFVVGLIGIILFSYEKAFQIAIIVAVALSYVSWGIIHHWIHKDLHLSVVIEYVVVATLGLVVALSLIGSA